MDWRNLEPLQAQELPTLMGWFTSAAACRAWGGTSFRFPFDARTFREDAMLDALPSLAYRPRGVLVGFGQFYARADRCHLGRVAIAPAQRGRGLGSLFIRSLAQTGCRALGLTECSLFVARGNPRAAALYERLGFRETAYPTPDPAVTCYRYFVISADVLLPGH